MANQETNINSQPKTITITIEEYQALQALQFEITYLKEQLNTIKKWVFGHKHERFIPSNHNPQQLSLELNVEPIAEKPAPVVEKITYIRQKQSTNKITPHGRQPLPAHLRREEIVIQPQEDVSNARKIGEEITEILEFKPGEAYVKKYIRPKYVIKNSENSIVIGQLPSLPLPKSNAGPSMLAHLYVSKYVDHMPIYRLLKQLKRENDIDIAQSTANNWLWESGKLTIPLYELTKSMVLSSDYLMVDETPIPVLTEDKPGSTHRGYLWVYYSPLLKLVFFDYQKSRGRAGPAENLKDFCGAIQTDGYAVYEMFHSDKIKLLACMAHVRRKFDEALKNNYSLAGEALLLIQQLYHIEQKARDEQMTFEQRKALRQMEALPILKELEIWLQTNRLKAVPKSSIGQAITYATGQWKKLIRYVDDGRYELDNNLIENSIRPVALGRKNYLFAGSHEAAQRIAMMYSFMGMCKMNNINPYNWLVDLFTNISDCKISQLHQFLPPYTKTL